MAVSFGSNKAITILVVAAVSTATSCSASRITNRRIYSDAQLAAFRDFRDVAPAPLPDRLAWLSGDYRRRVQLIRSLASTVRALEDEPDDLDEPISENHRLYVDAIRAIEVLLAVNDLDCQRHLVSLLASRNRRMRSWGFDLLARFGDERHKSHAYVGLLDDDRTIRRDSVRYLARLADLRAVPHLEALANRESSKRGKLRRIEIQRALARIRLRHPVDIIQQHGR